MKITIITKFDGKSADIFVGAIAVPVESITPSQQLQLRKLFDCDGCGETHEDDENGSNLFFRGAIVAKNVEDLVDLMNADGPTIVDPN